MRECVDSTIRSHCSFRGWALYALNVRSNHVHMVVRAAEQPETVMGQFKAWSSRRLREAGLIVPEKKLWTRHGSTLWLNRQEEVDEKVDYVVRLQDHPGRFDAS
ncbi:MAG: transposase [Phycisphaerales bacterium]